MLPARAYNLFSQVLCLTSPALRPSLPQRAGSGHQIKATLTDRFAGLDLHALASDLRYSRVTDEDACGAGSLKGCSLTLSWG